jgi:hypothetical protein
MYAVLANSRNVVEQKRWVEWLRKWKRKRDGSVY